MLHNTNTTTFNFSLGLMRLNRTQLGLTITLGQPVLIRANPKLNEPKQDLGVIRGKYLLLLRTPLDSSQSNHDLMTNQDRR